MSIPGIRWLATAFGLLMAAACAVRGDLPVMVLAAASAAAVLVGIRFRSAATLAVAVAAGAVVLGDVASVSATLAGLCAAGYLVLRHASGAHELALPTMVGALGLASVGYLATAVPLQLPWAPLAAPVALFAVYVIVLVPLR